MNVDLYGESISALWILALPAAYLLGNLSPAILISRASGVDIRTKGSRNAGTTNMLRVMGKKAAAATLVIDILKGVAAVLLGRALGGEALGVLCGLLAFVGHIWPALFGFRGGKGIATALGVLLAVDWKLGLLCLGAAALGLAVSRRVSVGSLLAAAVLPFAAWRLQPDHWLLFLLMTGIIYWKHRANIQRLLQGQEPKINLKK